MFKTDKMKLHANNTEKKEVINTNDLLDCIKTRAQITNIEIIVKITYD